MEIFQAISQVGDRKWQCLEMFNSVSDLFKLRYNELAVQTQVSSVLSKFSSANLVLFCRAGVSLHVVCSTLRVPCSDMPALPSGTAEVRHLSHHALPRAALAERRA